MSVLQQEAPRAHVCRHCGAVTGTRHYVREGDAWCCESCFLARRRSNAGAAVQDELYASFVEALSSDEWQVMQTHPESGFRIVSRLPGLLEAA